jgi:hypothetical protein
MKFKVADVPVNVLDGVEHNPKAVTFAVGVLLGILVSIVITGEKILFVAAVVEVVAGLVAAYFAGKPK